MQLYLDMLSGGSEGGRVLELGGFRSNKTLEPVGRRSERDSSSAVKLRLVAAGGIGCRVRLNGERGLQEPRRAFFIPANRTMPVF